MRSFKISGEYLVKYEMNCVIKECHANYNDFDNIIVEFKEHQYDMPKEILDAFEYDGEVHEDTDTYTMDLTINVDTIKDEFITN